MKRKTLIGLSLLGVTLLVATGWWRFHSPVAQIPEKKPSLRANLLKIKGYQLIREGEIARSLKILKEASRLDSGDDYLRQRIVELEKALVPIERPGPVEVEKPDG